MSTLRLDQPTMVVEEYGVVATTSVLTEISVPLPLSGTMGDAPPSPRLIYGGELVELTAPRRGHEQSVGVRLPAPLACGHGHQFGLVVIWAAGGALVDRHLHTCLSRCGLLVTRVRFARGWRPPWVRRVDGLRPEEVDGPRPGEPDERPSREDLLPVDSVGEVAARFHDLEAGRCYGFRWGRQGTPDGLYQPAGGRHRGAPPGGFLRNRQPLHAGSPSTRR